MPRFSDELDQAIMQLLEQDGRLPNIEIARRLGVSESAVRKRIARLVEQKGLRIVGSLDGTARATEMIFLIHTEAGYRLAVAERLAELPGVLQVALTTGSFDIFVRAAFSSDADALDFLVQHIEGSPGVRSAQTSHVLKNLLAGTPASVAVSGSRGKAGAEAALRELVVQLARAKDIPAVLECSCDVALAHLEVDRVLAWWIDDVSGRDEYKATRGLSAAYLQRMTELLRHQAGVGARVWKRRVHLYVEDATTTPLLAEVHDIVRQEGYRSLLFLPMLFGERIVGTIGFYNNRVRHYSDDEIALALAYADQVAMAVERLRIEDNAGTDGVESMLPVGGTPFDLLLDRLRA